MNKLEVQKFINPIFIFFLNKITDKTPHNYELIIMYLSLIKKGNGRVKVIFF